ncbi:DUF2927 domain-containing protein [Mastigocoleus testarum]|uniref:DUF2927 domain-containing protein n=1 Tax=Mastigocoleus testarum TaxID=996925 RepID=UPI00040E5E90|nr:DUF2927 domain-containing protein [Mastigocoleus testarum]
MKIKQIFVSGIRNTLALSIASTTIGGTILGIAISSSDAQTAVLNSKNPTSQINLRLAPSTLSDAVDYGRSGDRVIIRNNTEGMDGFTWYYVKLQETGITGWVRGDLVARGNRDKSVEHRSNIIPIPPENYNGINRQGINTSSSRYINPTVNSYRKEQNYQQAYITPNIYTPEEINYFLEIALGAEFSAGSNLIRKWDRDLRIKIIGSPTPEDLNTLKSVINEINSLVSGIKLNIVDNKPNVKIHFVPVSQFRRYEPNYQPGNYGYAWTNWNQNNTINSANILIASAGVNQQERSHLIREELTQSLGLLRDSYKYKNSIFYQPWTDTNRYSQIDKKVIQILYQPQIRPGMTKSQVINFFKRT